MVAIDGYEVVPSAETSLMKAVAQQPVSVAIEASSRDFMFYSEVFCSVSAALVDLFSLNPPKLILT